MQSLKTLLDLFRQNGLKITPQRRIILELLIGDDSHPTADAIYRRVIAVLPDVSRATVYNTLRELVALDALIEVHGLSEGGTRYDTNTGTHHHLFCTRCHALVDINRNFAGLSLSPEEAAGYKIMKGQVTFYGLCPTCQKHAEN